MVRWIQLPHVTLPVHALADHLAREVLPANASVTKKGIKKLDKFLNTLFFSLILLQVAFDIFMYFNSSLSFYLLRTPSFSLNKFFEINTMLGGSSLLEKQEELRLIFSDELFKEAIFLSSRNLYSLLELWLNKEITDNKKIESLLLSLHKYYSRMCTRCTPYGVLAGCSTGLVVLDKTRIEFSERKLTRSSRIDMGFLGRIIRHLEKNNKIRETIRFHVNSSAYIVNNKYRFVEYDYKQTKRQYSLSSLSRSKYLDLVFENSRFGLTKKDIINLIEVESNGVLGIENINSFVENLINCQFLVSEIDLRVTGNNFLKFITNRLKGFESSIKEIECLISAKELLEKSDINVSTYQMVEENLKSIIDTDSVDLIQTDMIYKLRSNIKADVIDEIVQTAEELSGLTKSGSMVALNEFRQEFYSRYDQQEIPLAVALDAELGIGYGNAKIGNIEDLPLIKGLIIPQSNSQEAISNDAVQKLIIKKFKEHCVSGHFTVEISKQELSEASMGNGTSVFASTSIIMGSILSNSETDLDKGDYSFYAQRINTPFAGKVPARFAVKDELLEAELIKCFEDEQSGDGEEVFAEILHIPDDRVCNIIIRPILHKYEIPYLCNSSVDEEYQISIDDLYLVFKQGKLILKSKKLGKTIIPRLTNSHNASKGIALYKFLCDFQYQDLNTDYEWDWGILSSELFLPRVVYRKYIISRARWFVTKLSQKEYLLAEKNKESFFLDFKKLRKVSKYVVIQENDNELVIDMDNAVCQQHLLQKMKQKDLILLEYLPTIENSFIKGDNRENFVSEIVIPTRNNKQISKTGSTFTKLDSSLNEYIERDFLPGSNWLYIKIYAGNKTLEEILVALAGKLTNNPNLEKWFFIKYNDPKTHLRIRFFSNSSDYLFIDLLKDINVFLAPLVKSKQIHSINIDTYNREIERYGSYTMELSESVFHFDSIAVAKMIAIISKNKDENLRWFSAIYCVDGLLDDFGFSLEEKYRLTKKLKNSFFNEFNQNLADNETSLMKSLNDKYRSDTKMIEALFKIDTSIEAVESDILVSMKNIIRERSVFISEISPLIKEKLANFPIHDLTLDNLVSSYIHMSLNRLFITKHRMHELVIYHYLYKRYLSLIKIEESAGRIHKK